jgi:hypothetical protein
LYVAGGYNTDHCLRSVEAYDPRNNHWYNVRPLEVSHPLTAKSARALPMMGALESSGLMISDARVYEATSRCLPAQVERSYLSMIEFNGSLYAIGGLDSGENALATVERYDPALNR